MATNFPASLDNSTSLPYPSATDDTNSPSLAGGQDNQNDAVIAVQTKLGIGSSAQTPVAGMLLYSATNGESAWSFPAPNIDTGDLVTLNAVQTLTNKNLTDSTNTFPAFTLGPTGSTNNNVAVFSGTTGGVLADSGIASSSLATLTGSQTLTNKLVVPRAGNIANAATITPSYTSYDIYSVTALAQSLFVNPAGTPTDGQKLIIRITSNSSIHSIAWDSSYAPSGVASLPTATVASKTITMGFIYDANVAAKWILLALDSTGY